MDDLYQFLHAHRSDWPIGRLETFRENHLMSPSAPFSHPLLADSFLKTADVVHVTIQGPKPLTLAAVKAFMRRIAKVAPNGILDFDVQPGVVRDGVVVSIFAAKLHE